MQSITTLNYALYVEEKLHKDQSIFVELQNEHSRPLCRKLRGYLVIKSF